MKQKRKSRFFTFIFSFIPGAAEMYMGFMKNGVTLMLAFFMSFLPFTFLSSLGILSLIGGVVWFFAFFHARNVAGLSDEEFYSMEDKYIWEEFSDFKGIGVERNTLRKWIAVILIVLGVAQLWNYIYELMVRMIPESYWDVIYPVLRDIPQVVMAILVILFGVYLIIGKKKELDLSPDVVITHFNELPQNIETKENDEKETSAEASETESGVKEA